MKEHGPEHVTKFVGVCGEDCIPGNGKLFYSPIRLLNSSEDRCSSSGFLKGDFSWEPSAHPVIYWEWEFCDGLQDRAFTTTLVTNNSSLLPHMSD